MRAQYRPARLVTFNDAVGQVFNLLVGVASEGCTNDRYVVAVAVEADDSLGSKQFFYLVYIKLGVCVKLKVTDLAVA
jgi:hypothetical protein